MTTAQPEVRFTGEEVRSTGRAAVQGAADADLAARLRLAVMRLSRRLRQQSDQGISQSQISALSTVERLGPLTLGELAGHEQVQPPSMTRIVAALEEAGLVARHSDESDRRVARVRATAEGRRVLQRSRTRKNAYLAKRLEVFDEAERQSLSEAVRLLERVLESDE